MKNIRDAAVIALTIVLIKLVFRIIPPADRFFSLFEDGVWAGLGVITAVYLIIFVIAWIALAVSRRRKEKRAAVN